MTGYGRATGTWGDKSISIEVRSLNSKFTDLRLKTSQNLREKETELRRRVTDFAQRGKLELNVEIKSAAGDESYGLNAPLFRRYFQELKSLSQELNMPTGDMLQAIVRLPNVVATEEDDIPEEEWQAILDVLENTLCRFKEFRKAEGTAMATDLRVRIENIQTLLEEIRPFEESRSEHLRERMRRHLDEYMSRDKVDENRFEQELLFYLEKMDITEERVRLAQHCKFFLEEMDKSTEVKGRKLAFIGQEIGREINTLGAKAYSADIQRIVVSMKDELEKIKEQVANIV